MDADVKAAVQQVLRENSDHDNFAGWSFPERLVAMLARAFELGRKALVLDVEKSDLLSRADAAAYLGIKAQTLAVWSCTKRYGLAMIKIGRLAKYRRSDLDAFIAARTIKPQV